MNQSHELYRSFLESVILPNIEIVAYGIALGEVTIGVLLVLGLLTRVAAALAMLFTFNYMLMKGFLFWTPASNDAAWFGIALVLILGSAGRALGLDYFLAKRYPVSMLW